MNQDLSQPDDRELVPSTASDSTEQSHSPSCRCWNCDIETTGLVKGLRAEIKRLTTQAQYLAELHARMVRELVDSRDKLKRHLDAIAEALHPGKPWKMCTHAGVVSKDECPWCKADEAYQPDQLAGIVRELQARLSSLSEQYREVREASRAGLSETERIAYPGTLDRIRFLHGERERLATARVDGERQWQPIETAPKDGNPVLLYWPYWRGRAVIGYFAYTGKWCCIHALTDGPGPTHWMPLPKPPSDQARANVKGEV